MRRYELYLEALSAGVDFRVSPNTENRKPKTAIRIDNKKQKKTQRKTTKPYILCVENSTCLPARKYKILKASKSFKTKSLKAYFRHTFSRSLCCPRFTFNLIRQRKSFQLTQICILWFIYLFIFLLWQVYLCSAAI